MNCANHPQSEAAGACMYCGKMFCSECLIEADGKMYCKNDITKVLQEARRGSVVQAMPNINIVNTNTSNSTANTYGGGAYSHKSKIVALLLCIFFGGFGIHRFYVGKIGTGLMWFFTMGFCGIGILIDFITILVGGFRDKNGQFLI